MRAGKKDGDALYSVDHCRCCKSRHWTYSLLEAHQLKDAVALSRRILLKLGVKSSRGGMQGCQIG